MLWRSKFSTLRVSSLPIWYGTQNFYFLRGSHYSSLFRILDSEDQMSTPKHSVIDSTLSSLDSWAETCLAPQWTCTRHCNILCTYIPIHVLKSPVIKCLQWQTNVETKSNSCLRIWTFFLPTTLRRIIKLWVTTLRFLISKSNGHFFQSLFYLTQSLFYLVTFHPSDDFLTELGPLLAFETLLSPGCFLIFFQFLLKYSWFTMLC